MDGIHRLVDVIAHVPKTKAFHFLHLKDHVRVVCSYVISCQTMKCRQVQSTSAGSSFFCGGIYDLALMISVKQCGFVERVKIDKLVLRKKKKPLNLQVLNI